jgi:hypothetical protein
LIALPACKQPVAKMIASRVKDTAAKVIGGTLRASGKASELSVSCGVHDTPDAFSKAIAAAEIACRAAKDHGQIRTDTAVFGGCGVPFKLAGLQVGEKA